MIVNAASEFPSNGPALLKSKPPMINFSDSFLDSTEIIPFETRYSILFRKSASPIEPSAYQPAEFFIQDGTSCAKTLCDDKTTNNPRKITK